MPQATFRFYAHLNRFLAPHRRQVAFDYPFEGVRSVKDMIEAAGVPHPEVHQIVVNGETVPLTYRVGDGDQVHVYPVFQSPDFSELPDRLPRFVADVHLGRLVAYMRMVGIDVLYPEDYRDQELARISAEEGRVLLTRDVGLLKRGIVTQGHYVRATNPWEQFAEVLLRFNLLNQIDTATARCGACNGMLQQVDKAAVMDRLLPRTRASYDEFWECADCHKLYWKGPHHQRLEEFLAALRSDL